MTHNTRAGFRSIDRWGSICSIIGFLGSAVGFVRRIQMPTATALPDTTRLQAILIIGLLAAAAHGALWSLVERCLSWGFGAGGRGKLPDGWSAVVLSATVTIPLIAVPLAYQALTGISIVRPNHNVAGVCVVVAGALGHLLMYGSKGDHFRGLRKRIVPTMKMTLPIALKLEVIWTCVHFGMIALVYRIIVMYPRADFASLLVGPMLGAGVFFFGVIAFIFLRYPGSLTESRWIEVRGVIAGLILSITLEGGMLM